MRRALEAALLASGRRDAVTAVVPAQPRPIASPPPRRAHPGPGRAGSPTRRSSARRPEPSSGGTGSPTSRGPARSSAPRRAFPALISRIELALPDGSARLARPPRSWCSPRRRRAGPGLGHGARLRGAVRRAERGLPRGARAAPLGRARPPEPPGPADARRRRSPSAPLEPFRRRANADHYLLLALERDADVEQVRARVRDAKRSLEALPPAPALAAPGRAARRRAHPARPGDRRAGEPGEARRVRRPARQLQGRRALHRRGPHRHRARAAPAGVPREEAGGRDPVHDPRAHRASPGRPRESSSRPAPSTRGRSPSTR